MPTIGVGTSNVATKGSPTSEFHTFLADGDLFNAETVLKTEPVDLSLLVKVKEGGSSVETFDCLTVSLSRGFQRRVFDHYIGNVLARYTDLMDMLERNPAARFKALDEAPDDHSRKLWGEWQGRLCEQMVHGKLSGSHDDGLIASVRFGLTPALVSSFTEYAANDAARVALFLIEQELSDHLRLTNVPDVESGITSAPKRARRRSL